MKYECGEFWVSMKTQLNTLKRVHKGKSAKKVTVGRIYVKEWEIFIKIQTDSDFRPLYNSFSYTFSKLKVVKIVDNAKQVWFMQKI